jgi:Ca2+-binding RTX toxin-like protein
MTVIHGTTGKDQLTGPAGKDWIAGSDGNDRLTGDTGDPNDLNVGFDDFVFDRHDGTARSARESGCVASATGGL